MLVKPSVKIVTHSTAATNSALGAMSCGLIELCAIVPNKTNAPIIPTKRLLDSWPLSPLNISINFFISPLPNTGLFRFVFIDVLCMSAELILWLRSKCGCVGCLCHYFNPLSLSILLMLIVSISAIAVSTPRNIIVTAYFSTFAWAFNA